MTKTKVLDWLAQDHGPVGLENWARTTEIAAIGGYSGVAALRISIWTAVALPVCCPAFAAAQRIARRHQNLNPQGRTMNNRFLARDAGAVTILELALAFILALPAVPALRLLFGSAFGMQEASAEQLNATAMVGLAAIVTLMAVSALMSAPLRRERSQEAEDASPARAMLLMLGFLSAQAAVLTAWVTGTGAFNPDRAMNAGLLFALTAAAAVFAFHRLARKALAAA